MSRFFPAYLVERFFYRTGAFLRNWYVGSFRFIFGEALAAFYALERFFALQANVRNITAPLFQDHTVVGHTLGFLFRVGRIALAVLVYLTLALAALAAYVLWSLLFIYILFRIAVG